MARRCSCGAEMRADDDGRYVCDHCERIIVEKECPTCGTPCVVGGLPDFPGDTYPVTCYYQPVPMRRLDALQKALWQIVKASAHGADAVGIAEAALRSDAVWEQNDG